MSDDRRLIEDYLPIQAISAEASRELITRRFYSLDVATSHLADGAADNMMLDSGRSRVSL